MLFDLKVVGSPSSHEDSFSQGLGIHMHEVSPPRKVRRSRFSVFMLALVLLPLACGMPEPAMKLRLLSGST